MDGPVIGRKAELAAAMAFLDTLPSGPAALLIEGEAGVGKTTIWNEAVRAAGGRGIRVLACRPVESEASLSFVGLSDLLGEHADTVLPELAPLQRRAIEVALLRTDPRGAPPDQRVIGAATTSVLSTLAEEGPVLVAVDDDQWLDRPTARSLAFAARRMAGRPVGFLVSGRTGGRAGDPVPFGLDRALPGDRLRRITLDGMSVAALHHLLHGRLSRTFSRRLLVRIAELSRGNPFFALEIGRALPDTGPDPGWGDVVPLPDTLRGLLEARLEELPRHSRRALLAAGAASRPTVELVAAVVGTRAVAGVRAAVRAGVVEVDDDRIRFTHPLLASALYLSASEEERRAIHRRLADAVTDDAERARHLALAAEGPDESVAATLERAAGRARARGGLDEAGDRYELAARLSTPRSAAAERRFLQAGACRFEAGEAGRAAELLQRVTASAPPGPVRGEARRLMGIIRAHDDAPAEAVELLELAAADAGGDLRLLVEVELTLFWLLTQWGNVSRGAEHARAAVRLVDGSDQASLLAPTLAISAVADLLSGRPVPEDSLARAVELEDWAEPRPADWRPSFIQAYVARSHDRADEARRGFLAVRRNLEERGEEDSLPFLLFLMSELESWVGNFSVARSLAEESLQVARVTEQLQLAWTSQYALALADAHLGRIGAARRGAREVLELGKRRGLAPLIHLGGTVLGFLDLTAGRPDDAVGVLDPIPELLAQVGLGDPALFRFLPDLVEALLEVGRVERAEAVLAPFEARAAALSRGWAQAVAARCRALILAADGGGDGALASLDRAEELHLALPYRFDHARTLLVRGRIHRRRREKRAAKDALDRAADLFREVGTRAWLRRTRAEIDRIGLRPPPPRQLSPTEARVAELAATGLTNRQVAHAAYLSPKTVESVLSRVYAKLGIRSRAELGAHMARQELAGEQT